MLKKLLILTKKELTAYFDSPIAYIFTAIFLIVSNWLFFQNFFFLGQVSMRAYFGYLPWILIFLLPSVTMRLLSEEKKSGTIEILLTLPVGETIIVLAKFLASWLFVSFMLALSLTVPLSLANLGDLEIGPVVGAYLGSWLMAGVYLALGLFVSAITKNQIVSFVLALAIGFVWWLVGAPFVTESAPVFFAMVLQLGSPMAHWQNSLRGLIDTRDLIFYLSFIVFWLYLSIFTIGARHWR